jgi:predicted dehydrogenase
MSTANSGMTYAPKGKPSPVCAPGEFIFAAAFLDHGHIYGQCNGLREAGGELRWVYDPDAARVKQFVEAYPGVKVARSFEEILDDASVKLVASAAVPCDRGPIGVQVMRAGKDYFTDKGPFTSLDQLETARAVARETKKMYACYYSERLHVECGMFATELVAQGAIGRVVQVLGFGPHRVGKPESRPAWFFDKSKYGGILCDIGSHQCEQFLTYAGGKDATVNFARVDNVAHEKFPGLEDFGEASFTTDNGVSCYTRVDWLTPEGLRTWGDGRTFILGTGGYIEMRKYIDVTTDNGGDQLILVDGSGERRIPVTDKVGFPFFGRLIRDSLDRTETAMTQAHVFKAAELCLKAQQMADANRV